MTQPYVPRTRYKIVHMTEPTAPRARYYEIVYEEDLPAARVRLLAKIKQVPSYQGDWLVYYKVDVNGQPIP